MTLIKLALMFYALKVAKMLHVNLYQRPFFLVHEDVIKVLLMLAMLLISFVPHSSFIFSFISLLLSHRSRTSAVIQGFFYFSVFSKGLVGCLGHGCVGIDEFVHVCVIVSLNGSESCKLPSYHGLRRFCYL